MEEALDRRLVLYILCTEHKSTKHGPGHRGYGPWHCSPLQLGASEAYADDMYF